MKYLVQIILAGMLWSSCCMAGTAMQRSPITFESEQVKTLYTQYDIGRLAPQETLPAAEGSIALYASPEVPGLLAVEFSTPGHVSHVGLHLFSADELTAFDPVGRFLERYFLTMYAQNLSAEMTLSMLKSQRIYIQINGYMLGTAGDVSNDVRGLLPYIEARRTCSLNWRDYEYIFTCTTEKDDRIKIRVPADVQLISGRDKKELQDELGRSVAHYAGPGGGVEACRVIPAGADLVPHREGLHRLRGRELHPGIRSEIYYQQHRRGKGTVSTGIRPSGLSMLITC